MQNIYDVAHRETQIKAVRHYGENRQIDVCVEEMAELTQARIKVKRATDPDEKYRWRMQVVEELADVEIMCEQLRIIFGIKEYGLDCMKAEKLNRLEERLAKEGC